MGILEINVDTEEYCSVDHVKQVLRREWAKIPHSDFRGTFNGFINRLITYNNKNVFSMQDEA